MANAAPILENINEDHELQTKPVPINGAIKNHTFDDDDEGMKS